jgi:hypothetical protein
MHGCSMTSHKRWGFLDMNTCWNVVGWGRGECVCVCVWPSLPCIHGEVTAYTCYLLCATVRGVGMATLPAT